MWRPTPRQPAGGFERRLCLRAVHGGGVVGELHVVDPGGTAISPPSQRFRLPVGRVAGPGSPMVLAYVRAVDRWRDNALRGMWQRPRAATSGRGSLLGADRFQRQHGALQPVPIGRGARQLASIDRGQNPPHILGGLGHRAVIDRATLAGHRRPRQVAQYTAAPSGIGARRGNRTVMPHSAQVSTRYITPDASSS